MDDVELDRVPTAPFGRIVLGLAVAAAMVIRAAIQAGGGRHEDVEPAPDTHAVLEQVQRELAWRQEQVRTAVAPGTAAAAPRFERIDVARRWPASADAHVTESIDGAYLRYAVHVARAPADELVVTAEAARRTGVDAAGRPRETLDATPAFGPLAVSASGQATGERAGQHAWLAWSGLLARVGTLVVPGMRTLADGDLHGTVMVERETSSALHVEASVVVIEPGALAPAYLTISARIDPRTLAPEHVELTEDAHTRTWDFAWD